MRFFWLAGASCIVLAMVAGCSGSPSSSSAASPPTAAGGPSASAPGGARVSGTASVAYDSALGYLDENVVRPAFEAATGAGYTGTGNTSGALAGDITTAEISPDVFESVGGGNITPLAPKFTTWYIQYASTSVVVAYNPKGKFAPRFKAIADGRKPLKDLFTLLETRGLRLGRTDPVTDPQARDFIMMLELAQSRYHLPEGTVARILGTSDYASPESSQIYPESALDATLQAGQLDAASAFASQAVQLHLDYIRLPAAIDLGNLTDAALYRKASVTVGGKIYRGSPQVIDITTIGAPTPAAEAFVAYTLSQAGLAQYRRGGFTMIKPTVFGDRSAVPAPVLSELGR